MKKYFGISYLLYLCMYMPRYLPDISKAAVDMYICLCIYIYIDWDIGTIYIYIKDIGTIYIYKVNHDITNSPQKDTQKCFQDNIDNIDYICMTIT